MRRLLFYTTLRFALFLVTLLLLWVLLRDHLSPWVLALFALLISSVASFVLLRGQAEQAGTEFAGRWRSARNRLDEAKRREDDELEDADDDESLGQQVDPGSDAEAPGAPAAHEDADADTERPR